MTRYKTKSGSLYEVDGLKVRRVVRSALSNAERVSDEWREAESINCNGIGFPLAIMWGEGRDEHSDKAVKVGTGTSDDPVVRWTTTSRVMEIEKV